MPSLVRIFSLLAIFGLVATPLLAAEAPSVEEVLERLGYSEQDKKALRAGRIIATDVTRTRDDQLIAALAVRIDVPLAVLAANAEQGLNIARDPGTKAFGVMTEAGHRNELESLDYPRGANAEVKRLLKVRPDGTFNLSASEIDSLRQALKGVKAGGPNAADKATEAYRSVLAARFLAYLQSGFDGIADYDHADASLKPAKQLRAVLAQVAPFFEQHFPAFGQAMLAFPEAQGPDISNRIYWISREVEGRPAVVLAHQAVQAGKDFVLMSQRQFFVGHTYETLQVYALALPMEAGSVVFYLNSAFTEQVAGFFSGVAHAVGQGRMKDDLSAYFEALKARQSN